MMQRLPRGTAYQRGSISFETVEAVHVGSTTLADDNGAAQTLALISDAKSSATISFDPNCRPNLVKDKPRYLARMSRFCETADIVRMSDVDFSYLYGDQPYRERANALLADGAGLVIITRGIHGAVAWHPAAGQIEIAAPAATVIDTIGAGDSFQAALLVALHKQGRLGRQQLENVDAGELRRAPTFAANCAALTCTRPGADPPRSSEIEF